jgi:diadenosine tetraphosphate (Ap4A) HIT family hydrolase
MLADSCIFCKIIKGAIPSHKIIDTPMVYAFLDINPLSSGHVLIIPKFHAGRLHQIPDEYLSQILPNIKKVYNALKEASMDSNQTNAKESNMEEWGEELQYNILQNNGRMAHQEVDHVHFHLIPKRNNTEGLGIKWNTKTFTNEELANMALKIKSKLDS